MVSSSGRIDGAATWGTSATAGAGAPDVDDAGGEGVGVPGAGGDDIGATAAGAEAGADRAGTTPALDTRSTGDRLLDSSTQATTIAAAAAVRPSRSHRRVRSSREITRTIAGRAARR